MNCTLLFSFFFCFYMFKWYVVLRGEADFAYVFKKFVDGPGTQSSTKNLNLKKSKRCWGKISSEVNDYVI